MGKERIRTSGRTEWKFALPGACIFAIVASFPLLATKAKAPVGMDAAPIVFGRRGAIATKLSPPVPRCQAER
jgi:hypothetical protein